MILDTYFWTPEVILLECLISWICRGCWYEQFLVVPDTLVNCETLFFLWTHPSQALASSITPQRKLLFEQVQVEDADKYETGWSTIKRADGVIVPGGFGHRGTEGMIAAAQYCRENRKPYLGICLGMQV